jgi:hypothetical protein
MRRVAELMHVFPGAVVDRRLSQDRRTDWRGGRRDEDWTSRPQGAMTVAERRQPGEGGWRRWFSVRVSR